MYVIHPWGAPDPHEVGPDGQVIKEEKKEEEEGPKIGKSCWRQAYSRGNGTEASCRSDQELGFNGCYAKCSEGYEGAGVFCASKCPD